MKEMRLSEAMMRGILKTKPAYGAMVEPGLDDVLKACALGAAMVGLGFTPASDYLAFYHDFIHRYPELSQAPDGSPLQNGGMTLEGWIVNQNDLQLLTREEIAEHIRQMEK